MFFVDTHTHIYDKEFDVDRNEVVQRAVENGVQMLLLPNVDVSTIAPMLDTNSPYSNISPVGSMISALLLSTPGVLIQYDALPSYHSFLSTIGTTPFSFAEILMYLPFLVF